MTGHASDRSIAAGAYALEISLPWARTARRAQVVAARKPVMGHVIATRSHRAVALRRGASGVMVSDLLRVAP